MSNLTRRKVMQKHDMRRFHNTIVDETQRKLDSIENVARFCGASIGVDYVTFEELQTTDIPEEIIRISQKINQETL